MFGNSLFRGFDNDPFFSDIQARHNDHMRRMDQMMGGGMFPRDPFFGGGTGRPQQQSIEDRRSDRNRNERRAGNEMMPFGGDMFGGFGNMFNAQRDMMGNMMTQMSPGAMQNNPNCHSYSSSTVMSYSNTGDGQPKMYQASSSTRTAPGGIRETRKQVRDSESGMDKMAVGHHIHDRGHVLERSRNRRTGDRDESQEFLNIEEDEIDRFNQEWKDRTGHFNTEQAAIRDRMRRPQHGSRRAIGDSHHHHRSEQHGYRDRGDRK